MKERPILFSGEMVRAILDGRKTQTRRLINPQPCFNGPVGIEWANDIFFHDSHGRKFRNKFGRVGDHLWLRETFCNNWEWFESTGIPIDLHEVQYIYKSDCTNSDAELVKERKIRWRPSIHMPRWASRITLEITVVRVERLQEITVEDIIAEGLSTTLREFDACCHLKEQWIQLWDSINADRAPWEGNPWVFVIEFKRIK